MKRILIVLLVAFSIIGAFSLGFLINNKPINKEKEKEVKLELNTEEIKEEEKKEIKPEEEKIEVKQEIKVEKQYRCVECDKYVSENDFNKLEDEKLEEIEKEKDKGKVYVYKNEDGFINYIFYIFLAVLSLVLTTIFIVGL